MSKKSKFPKVSERVVPGTIDENHLSGPVTAYYMPREEIEKLYGPIESKEPTFFDGWPTAGQPNTRHIAKRLRIGVCSRDEEQVFTEEDYIDPEWGLQNDLGKRSKRKASINI